MGAKIFVLFEAFKFNLPRRHFCINSTNIVSSTRNKWTLKKLNIQTFFCLRLNTKAKGQMDLKDKLTRDTKIFGLT